MPYSITRSARRSSSWGSRTPIAAAVRAFTISRKRVAVEKGVSAGFAPRSTLSTIAACNKVLVLSDGEVRAFGLREELERDDPYYADALRLARLT